jgi:sugar phosphate permease
MSLLPANNSHIVSNSAQHAADLGVKASLRKRWLYLLPAVFVTYSLAYLDRANFGFGAAAGLAATLHISDKQTSLLGSLFFLGYFIFQLPGAMAARRYSTSRMVFVSLIAWGILAALTGIIGHFWLLALVRFLLGVAESLIFPAMLLLLTRWFTRSERSRANSFLILGNPVTVLWMSAITGYLIQAFGWQKTFIIEGLPSILWAVIWIGFVKDRPSEANWMTPQAGRQLETQLAQEQLSVARVPSLHKALLRGDVMLLSVQFFFWSVGVYGFVLWLPTIVRQGGGFMIGQTGLLSALPYVAAIALMLIVSLISDRTLIRQTLVWPFLLAAGIALFGSFIFAEKSFTMAFICLVVGGGCMYAPYGPFFAIVPERVPANVTAEVLALINSSGALGAFFGSYFVGLLRAVTGNSRAGYMLMSLSLICSAFLLLCLPKPPQLNDNKSET